MSCHLKSQAFFLICFQWLVHEALWKGDSSRRVAALDLERGNNSNACNSVLFGSVWGQIYWTDLDIVAAGHRSSTPDVLQNQSLLTFVKLMKMFHMLKCWFFQQHLTNQIKTVINIFSCFLSSSRLELMKTYPWKQRDVYVFCFVSFPPPPPKKNNLIAVTKRKGKKRKPCFESSLLQEKFDNVLHPCLSGWNVFTAVSQFYIL